MSGGSAAAGGAAAGAPGAAPARWMVRAAAGRLAAILAAERDRWVLWLPVLFATGIGLYFGLRAEPWAGWAPLGVAAAALAAGLGRRRTVLVLAAGALAAVSAGFGLAQWQANAVAAPVLAKRWGPAEASGRVVAVEVRPEGRRLILDRVRLAGLAPERTPATIRVRLRDAPEIHVGDRVALRAVLMPPPAPAAPGAYDFQRQAWFDRLGAVGYAIGPVRSAGAEAAPHGWRLRLNELRRDVVERVLAAVPGPAGGVVVALLTGEQGAVAPEVMAWMRDAGLAHLLSVSGLHVSLVAGFVFLVVRGALALVAPLALRHPIKKWAAAAALAAITLYMFFVAPGVPIQRAWLMGAVVLAAILIDRSALSMRLVAWAAAAVLAVTPESLLGPSFQMSFAAVVALIAAWEAGQGRFAQWRAHRGAAGRLALGLAAIALTTLVASLATTPYALYHFNRLTALGAVANLAAVPLTSVWVMPWAVVTFALLPFGLEAWGLAPMGWGTDAIVWIAQTVAAWDGAAALLPAMPLWGLLAATAGGLWLCLWRTRWRLAGVPLVALGLASIALHRGPDVLIAADGRLMAVRGPDGELALSSGRAGRIARETWVRRAGQEADRAAVWPQTGASADGLLACDRAGCLYRAQGHVVAFVRDPAALAADCRHAGVVVAAMPVRRGCPAPVVIDRFALWREGGHALWLGADGAVRVETVRASRGERLWVPRPEAQPRRALAAAQ